MDIKFAMVIWLESVLLKMLEIRALVALWVAWFKCCKEGCARVNGSKPETKTDEKGQGCGISGVLDT